MADPQELSEDELFDGATSDEAPAEAAAESAGESVEQPSQPRDEAGRFAGKPENEPEAAAATEKPAREPVDDNAAMVPSWRVREINEEKRALAERIAAYEAERLQWQQRQQQQKPAEKTDDDGPDPLLQPKEYKAAIREELRQELLAERREESLQRAAETHPEEFKEAYTAAQKAVDPALKARMQSSRDPGKTLLEWHRENKVKAEVGSDPNAWLEKKLEERLKDPAFLAKAVELARGSAAPAQPNGRPRVELPPSLNGASRSNAALRAAQSDMSDDELWESTTA